MTDTSRTAQAKKMTRAISKPPHIMAPPLKGWSDGEKSLFVARPEARSIAQNLIDTIDDHRHLRESRILILFETGAKPDADGRLRYGKASKATPRMRLLTGGKVGLANQADFCIRLNGDTWGDLEEIGKVGLVDHELSHCAATIAGQYVTEARAIALAKHLGDDHIETHHNDRDDKGRVLLRYLKRPGLVKPGKKGYSDQRPGWRTRKHTVEEFVTVAGRWGAWDSDLRALVDVMDPADDGQMEMDFDSAGDPPGTGPAEANAADVKVILKTKNKTEALVAITECSNLATLRAADDAGPRGDWRRAAIATRIQELEKQAAA